MNEADGEVACVEALTAARVKSALDELYHEQLSHGAHVHAARSMLLALHSAERPSPPIILAPQAPSTGSSARSPRSGPFCGAIGPRLRSNPPPPLCGSAES